STYFQNQKRTHQRRNTASPPDITARATSHQKTKIYSPPINIAPRQLWQPRPGCPGWPKKTPYFSMGADTPDIPDILSKHLFRWVVGGGGWSILYSLPVGMQLGGDGGYGKL